MARQDARRMIVRRAVQAGIITSEASGRLKAGRKAWMALRAKGVRNLFRYHPLAGLISLGVGQWIEQRLAKGFQAPLGFGNEPGQFGALVPGRESPWLFSTPEM